MNGLLDSLAAVADSPAVYNALAGVPSKTIVQIGCASHALFFEGCTGSVDERRDPEEFDRDERVPFRPPRIEGQVMTRT
jgi:hypothetical protein